MTRTSIFIRRRLIKVSCWLALVAIGLMTWSIVDPHPLSVVVAMSAGQAIGTLALAAFLWAVFTDVRRRL